MRKQDRQRSSVVCKLKSWNIDERKRAFKRDQASRWGCKHPTHTHTHVHSLTNAHRLHTQRTHRHRYTGPHSQINTWTHTHKLGQGLKGMGKGEEKSGTWERKERGTPRDQERQMNLRARKLPEPETQKRGETWPLFPMVKMHSHLDVFPQEENWSPCASPL